MEGHKEDTRQCPFCGETIKAEAKKCRFCGQWLNEIKEENREQVVDNSIETNREETNSSNLIIDASNIQNTLIQDVRQYQLGHTENDIACPTCDYFGKMAITSMPNTRLAQSLAVISGIAILINSFFLEFEFSGVIIAIASGLIVISIIIGYFGRVYVKCPKCKSTLYLK